MYEAAASEAQANGATDGQDPFGQNGARDAGTDAEDDATVEGEFREVGSDRRD